MTNVLRFLRSVRHTRLAQLAARARRILQRAVLERVARRIDGARLIPSGPEPVLAFRLPLAPFAPRRDLVAGDGDGRRVLLLNVERALGDPIEWRPSEAEWTQLERMHLHYMEWVEGTSDDSFARAVDDWIANVPPYRPGYWRDEWNSYALSIRVVVWMQQIATRRRRLPQSFVERAARSIAIQLRFLERNLETDIGGNHLLKNVVALAWAGRFFEGPEARRWSGLGARILRRELDRQFLSDGLHFERSPAYHAQVCADLLTCRVVVEDAGLIRALDETIASAVQALADLTHPDGCVSLFNDGGLHMTYAPAEIVAVHERIHGTRPVARAQISLDAAGYHGYREGRTLLLFDCGAIAPDHLPAHGHGDALAFEWTLHGERIFVDAGVCEYRAGPKRDRSRSTRAHNTVTLDDLDQCEFWSSFRMGRRARVWRSRLQILPDGLVIEGLHDGYAHRAGAPIHRRLLRATANDLCIEDRIEGGAGQAVRARFLCHPSAKVAQSRDGWITITQGRVQARLTSESPITIEDATWSPDFGLELATKQIVVHHGSAPRVGAVRIRSLVPVDASAPFQRTPATTSRET